MPRLVEFLPSGSGTVVRETHFNAPVEETILARADQLGPFLQVDAAASQTAVAMTLGNVATGAQVDMPAGWAGTIVGMVAYSNATVTGNSATFAPTLNGTAQTSTIVLNTTNTPMSRTIFPTAQQIPFTAGQRLGVKITTLAGWLPVTADLVVYLLVRWEAS